MAGMDYTGRQKGRAAHPSRAAAPSLMPAARAGARAVCTCITCTCDRRSLLRERIRTRGPSYERDQGARSPSRRAGDHVTRRRIAVVGSGVAGLTAAHVLQGAADVTLYESSDRLGGHADTHEVSPSGRMLSIDTGFIVHNRRTYPTLLRLFGELGVDHPGVGHEHVDLVRWVRARVRRRTWPVGLAAVTACRQQSAILADADRSRSLPPARAQPARRRRRRVHAERVHQAPPLLALLRRPLRHAARRRGLVDRTQPRR